MRLRVVYLVLILFNSFAYPEVALPSSRWTLLFSSQDLAPALMGPLEHKDGSDLQKLRGLDPIFSEAFFMCTLTAAPSKKAEIPTGYMD